MYHLNQRTSLGVTFGISVFLFLFSFFTANLSAQETDNPFPTIMVKDSAGTSSPLRMSELKVEVKVIGNLATTTMEMNFHNDLDRILEGQLYFPLGEGQTVSHFAMDVEGKLREGVVVEKKQGRVAFESTVRRKIDPGLLEWTAGNNFKSRVYPIPAKGNKRILIAFEQELPHTDAGTEYRLPLAFQEKLDVFELKIEVFDQPEAPDLHGNELEGLQFKKFERVFSAKMEKKDYLANQQLAFRLPKPSKYTEIFIEQAEKGDPYFFLHLSPEITEKPKELPKKICLLWDVSTSAKGRDLEKELGLLDAYFATIKDAEVQLITFSVDIHSRSVSQLTGGEWPALRSAIKGLDYDGATRLGCLDLNEFSCDEFLLFSDGISNFGESVLKEGKTPVYTVNSQATANHTQLAHIATATGGLYLNLNELKPEAALAGLRLYPFRFISAEYTPGTLNELYPATPKAIYRDFSLAGRIKSANATITLNFGIGNEILDKQVIVLNQQKQQSNSGLVQRIWAQKKLAELELDAEKNEAAITQLGKAYSIVTRNTSLIVLDRLEDYITHKIVPPKELQEAYFEKIESDWNRETESKSKRIDAVVQAFKARKDWWNKEFTWPQPGESPKGGDDDDWGDDDDDWGGLFGDDIEEEMAMEVEEEIVFTEDISEPQAVEAVPRPQLEQVVITTNGNSSVTLEDRRNEVNSIVITNRVQERSRSSEREIETVAPVTVTTNEVEGTEEDWGSADGSSGFGEDDWGEENSEEVVLKVFEPLELDEQVNATIMSNDLSYTAPMAASPILSGSSSINNILATVPGLIVTSDSTSTIQVRGQNMAGKGAIQLQSWNPDEPYLRILQATPDWNLYKTYLTLKPEYASQPSFFLDCSDYFRQKGQEKESLRILSNIAEMELDNYRLLRVLGHRLRQLEETELAVSTFREVLKMREEEPQSYRDLALALADQGNTQEAVDHLWTVIENPWDGRFDGIEVIAVEELNHIAQQAKRKPNLEKVDKRLQESLPLNIRVVVNWDADNCDMDLWVIDPTGEKCYYDNQDTHIGGLMSNDFTGGYGPEEFLLRRAMPGTYRVMVDYYGDSQQTIAGPTTVQVSMYTDFGTRKEVKRDVTLRLRSSDGNIPIGEFVYGK